MQINMVNSKEWQLPNNEEWAELAREDWDDNSASLQYDITALEERQIKDLLASKGIVMLRNKKLVPDTMVRLRDPLTDATHPNNPIHKSLSYRACATTNYEYY